jgi:hypothetical protein
MNWWQTILVISACTCWSLFSALVGASIANTVHAARDAAEAAKWQVPDAIKRQN